MSAAAATIQRPPLPLVHAGQYWLEGAIGNAISILIRAMLYGKSDADPMRATALAEAAGFGFVPDTIVRPMEEK